MPSKQNVLELSILKTPSGWLLFDDCLTPSGMAKATDSQG